MNRTKRGRRPTRFRPGLAVEGLETRELMSAASWRLHMARAAMHRPIGQGLDVPPPEVAAKIAGQQMTPTPHEVAKSSVDVTATGSYLVGPGRFEGQQS